jgi:hypothetical protein
MREVEMSESNNSEDENTKGYRVIFWIIIFLIGIIDIYILNWQSSIFIVGVIGIITFSFILIGLNVLTGNKKLCQGEMRKAITITFIVVYLALLALSTNIDVAKSYTGMFQIMIDHFTYLVGIVVVFYFGSRAVEKYIEKKYP